MSSDPSPDVIVVRIRIGYEAHCNTSGMTKSHLRDQMTQR